MAATVTFSSPSLSTSNLFQATYTYSGATVGQPILAGYNGIGSVGSYMSWPINAGTLPTSDSQVVMTPFIGTTPGSAYANFVITPNATSGGSTFTCQLPCLLNISSTASTSAGPALRLSALANVGLAIGQTFWITYSGFAPTFWSTYPSVSTFENQYAVLSRITGLTTGYAVTLKALPPDPLDFNVGDETFGSLKLHAGISYDGEFVYVPSIVGTNLVPGQTYSVTTGWPAVTGSETFGTAQRVGFSEYQNIQGVTAVSNGTVVNSDGSISPNAISVQATPISSSFGLRRLIIPRLS